MEPIKDFGAEVEARLRYVAGVLAANPQWIFDFGEGSDPYFGKAAAQHLQQRFGISLRAGTLRNSSERVSPPDGSPPFDEFVCEAEFQTQDGAVIPARGSAGTDEPYVAPKRKDGSCTRTWGQIRDTARELATTRMYKRAVCAAVGLDALTWDDLERHGLHRGQVVNTRAGKGASRPAATQNPQSKPAVDFLWKVFKGEQPGLAKEDLATATTAVCGGFRKINELEPGQAVQIAERLDAQLRGASPAQAAPASAPMATPAAEPTAQSAPAPSQPTFDFSAAFAEMKRLQGIVNMDSAALRALMVEVHGSQWQGKSPPPATLERTLARLRAMAGEVDPADVPDIPL